MSPDRAIIGLLLRHLRFARRALDRHFIYQSGLRGEKWKLHRVRPRSLISFHILQEITPLARMTSTAVGASRLYIEAPNGERTTASKLMISQNCFEQLKKIEVDAISPPIGIAD